MNNETINPELATWEKPRTTEQLLGFIARRESEIFSTEA